VFGVTGPGSRRLPFSAIAHVFPRQKAEDL
jgi:hypothetical protein